MKATEIKQAVQELARANFNSFKNDYLSSLPEALDMVQNIAEGYFENRTESEVLREEENFVDLEDYKRWISWELCNWLNEQEEMKFTSVDSLTEWTKDDIRDNFGFDDLVTDENIFTVDFALLHKDDRINFIFKIKECDGFDSKLELEEITSI